MDAAGKKMKEAAENNLQKNSYQQSILYIY
jgi:hypothetical protein